MANRTKRTPKKEAAFLDALRDGLSVTAACLDAGIARSSAYEWRAEDAGFRERWDDAVEEGTDRLEDEAQRRARDGVTEPVFYKGHRVGEVQRYSDTLMIFLLKARRPDKFKDRVANEHSGPNGGPIQTEEVSPRERIASRIARLAPESGAGEDSGGSE